jgi:hypothetical protein
MAKADRINAQIHALEDAYRKLLLAELAVCARGTWGLFGHNEGLHPSLTLPAAVMELVALADDIDGLRARVGDEPFALHQRFAAARGRSHDNAPGEPKLAAAWLDELAR